MSSGKFRKFSSSVPVQLQNRPKKFVKHCIERMEAANDYEKSKITSLSTNIYNIKVGQRNYVVNMGDAVTYPNCDCKDWYEHHMPCVHMFALMSRQGEISWDLLSPMYMQSVYCIIDDTASADDVISRESGHQKQMNTEMQNLDCLDEDDKSQQDSIESLQKKARDSIKKLNNVTCNITDPIDLKKIQETIDSLLKDIYTTEVSTSHKFIPLRKRLSRKKFANRSGIKASILKKHSKLEVKKGTSRSKSHGKISAENDSVLEDATVCLPGEEVCETVAPTLTHNYIIEDHQDLCNEVKGIWNEGVVIEDRSIGPYTVTTESIRCIDGLLSDEVIDSYLHQILAWENNPLKFHINCITMTGIFEDQEDIHHCLRRVPKLMTYDCLIGAYNQGGCHWCLIFLKSRFDLGLETELPNEWMLPTIKHAKQLDGSSCGVYVLKFAENYLTGKGFSFNWSGQDVKAARLSLAVFILSVSEPRKVQGLNRAQCNEPLALNQEALNDLKKCNGLEKDDDVRVVDEDLTKETEEKSNVRNKPKRKRSSFWYPALVKQRKNSSKKVYCVCRRPHKKSECMWCCDECSEWFHPRCIGRSDEETPPRPETSYLCNPCLEKQLKDWPVVGVDNLIDDSDEGDEGNEVLVKVVDVEEHLIKAYQRCWYIIHAEGEKSPVPWMQRHMMFVRDGPRSSYGYGEALFSQQAIFMITVNLRNRFQRKKEMSHTYIDNVLLKEAMIAIVQEVTGDDYASANNELKRTEARSRISANRLILNYMTEERSVYCSRHRH